MTAPLCPLCLERTVPEGKRLCTVCYGYEIRLGPLGVALDTPDNWDTE